MSNYLEVPIGGTKPNPLVAAVAGASLMFICLLGPSQAQGFHEIKKSPAAVYEIPIQGSKTKNYLFSPSLGGSNLVGLIDAERHAATVDPNCIEIADAATRDAIIMVRNHELGGNPNVLLSEDGILALQWQRGEYGVALLFAGDGFASISFRRPGQFYAENGLDVALSDDLPRSFNDALKTILSAARTA